MEATLDGLRQSREEIKSLVGAWEQSITQGGDPALLEKGTRVVAAIAVHLRPLCQTMLAASPARGHLVDVWERRITGDSLRAQRAREAKDYQLIRDALFAAQSHLGPIIETLEHYDSRVSS